ncbi:MAG: hypothetical protein HZC37_05140 [Burkholderiales bacterium]|nr:hypothetical protein [Burkholderiales bacterium]
MPLPTEDRRKSWSRPGRVVHFGHAPRSDRRSTLGAGASGLNGLNSSPPSLRHAPDSAWQRFMFWLLAPAPQEAAPPLNRLPGVRDDFIFAIADLPGAAAHALRHRILHAHSLRDLWHLRAELFNLVSVEHAQSEAERRLLRLNRHFPRRAARSQFGSLGAL